MTNRGLTEEFYSVVVDDLPESINRRKFLMGTVATMGSLGLAGCTGGRDSGESGNTSKSGGTGPIWRYGWKAEPSYSVGFVAEQRDTWSAHLDTPPNVKEGFGSGDAAKRVGTGKEAMGMAAGVPVIINFAKGGEYKIYGAGKARSQLGLIYNAERINGRDDLQGITVTRSGSAPQQLSWPFFRDSLGYSKGDMTVKGANEAGAAAQLGQGKIDAVYDTITDWTAIRSKIDTKIGFISLYSVVQIYGYNTFVNTSFLENRGTDYMANLMTAYSKAGKWVMLNPKKAVEIMRQEVNTDLQTVSVDSLLKGLRAGVIAVNTTDVVKKNGFGYLDTDILSKTIEVIGNASELKLPSVDEIAATEIQENAELSSFSDSEWQQVLENGKPFTKQFG